MLATLFMIILLSIFWAVIGYGLVKVLLELIYLINMASNMYRFYHILAFFMVLLVLVFAVVSYFNKFVELAKLLD